MVPRVLGPDHLGRPPALTDVIVTPRLELLLLALADLDGILAGRTTEIAGAALPLEWVRRYERVLRLRRDQIAREPRRAPWLLRVMVERESRALVGNIGFHGPPGSNALGAREAVELGYGVQPSFRRRGYAEEAVRGMIARARAHGIARFIASVSPMNAPSLSLVRKLGFVEVTRVIDDVDGEEIVFELKR